MLRCCSAACFFCFAILVALLLPLLRVIVVVVGGGEGAAAATVNCFRVLFGWQQTNCVLRFVLTAALLLLSAQRSLPSDGDCC